MSAKHQVDDIRKAGRAFSTRVPGHALQREGMAYRATGKLPGYVMNVGHGKCSCGALSPELESDNARKAWHRQHKLDVLTGGAS